MVLEGLGTPLRQVVANCMATRLTPYLGLLLPRGVLEIIAGYVVWPAAAGY